MNVVIKYGGNAMHAYAKDAVLEAIARHAGCVALVHGGGPQIGAALAGAGIDAPFIGGLRVTAEHAMPLVETALMQINRAIVGKLRSFGRAAVGADGRNGALFSCARAWGPSGEDLGRVGKVATASPRSIGTWWNAGLTPVVAPLGTFGGGTACNVNADEVAGALAGALRVPAIFVTDVPGVVIDGTVVDALDVNDVIREIETENISGGMIPKTRACVRAVRQGAPYAVIVAAGEDVFSGGTRIGGSLALSAR